MHEKIIINADWKSTDWLFINARNLYSVCVGRYRILHRASARRQDPDRHLHRRPLQRIRRWRQGTFILLCLQWSLVERRLLFTVIWTIHLWSGFFPYKIYTSNIGITRTFQNFWTATFQAHQLKKQKNTLLFVNYYNSFQTICCFMSSLINHRKTGTTHNFFSVGGGWQRPETVNTYF